LNNWAWCSDNSCRSTSWLALHCRFGLNRACLLVSINVCIGLTSLSSPLACTSKTNTVRHRFRQKAGEIEAFRALEIGAAKWCPFLSTLVRNSRR
jgi:hypothetical protein